MLPLQGFIRLWHFLFLILKPVHCVPDTCSSDIESFRLYGQFLVGPERNRISYNKIFRSILAGPDVDDISGTHCISAIS